LYAAIAAILNCSAQRARSSASSDASSEPDCRARSSGRRSSEVEALIALVVAARCEWTEALAPKEARKERARCSRCCAAGTAHCGGSGTALDARASRASGGRPPAAKSSLHCAPSSGSALRSTNEMSVPAAMPSWNVETSMPRRDGGASSETMRGLLSKPTPMPTPAVNRAMSMTAYESAAAEYAVALCATDQSGT